MKERPVLFNGEMVRAILGGQKTQTRREFSASTLKTFNVACRLGEVSDFINNGIGKNDLGYILDFCPYGKIGDLLWVRETCQAVQDGMTFGINYPADNHTRWLCRSDDTNWLTMYDYRGASGAIVPSIHMRRWASRITLEITNVRVERLQNINTEDIRSEGIKQRFPNVNDQFTPKILLGQFMELWDSIYKNWSENPWVWVIEFKQVQV